MKEATAPESMTKLRIKLRIAGKSYSLTIDSEKEELYRKAEREVNEYATRFEKANFEGFTREDCLAMAALQLGFDRIESEVDRSPGSEQEERLVRLDDQLERYLNTLE